MADGAHDQTQVLTVEEAARMLRISRGAAYALAKAGTLPGVFRLGRTLRVSRAALERILTGDAPAVLPSQNQVSVSSRR
jgi:excisionase family DNA binding protein